MDQVLIRGSNSHKKIGEILSSFNCNKFLLVCDSSFSFLSVSTYFDELEVPYVKFSEFTPNPIYEDVCKGVALFNSEECDTILAVGGGSSLDVAKCIKLYAKMDARQNYLKQEYNDSKIPLIAMPTTAGTGSESTRYAVIYYDGKKQSVTHESIIPNVAILNHCLLKTLPEYQKKCTLLDALCQAIESWWSVNSTDESKGYSKLAIENIMKYMDAYLCGNEEASERILLAANYAGRAINITQTTAVHAMSYKLTAMYGLPHGHAVAVCLPFVWGYMVKNRELCMDERGWEYLEHTMENIADSLGFGNVLNAIEGFSELLLRLGLKTPNIKEPDIQILANSVNGTRLGNHPVHLSHEALYQIYSEIQRSALK